MKKKKCKSRARSLANLVPGGNFRHGAYAFRRTSKIPGEHADIGEEARHLGNRLREEYCRPENFLLNTIQAVPIRQLVSEFVFAELLVRHLWAQAAQAGGGLERMMASSACSDWIAAGNRMNRRFRQLRRNLRDFRQ
jgi:hypothetical protein